MPEQWEADIYNHETNKIMHEFIAEIDVDKREVIQVQGMLQPQRK